MYPPPPDPLVTVFEWMFGVLFFIGLACYIGGQLAKTRRRGRRR